MAPPGRRAQPCDTAPSGAGARCRPLNSKASKARTAGGPRHHQHCQDTADKIAASGRQTTHTRRHRHQVPSSRHAALPTQQQHPRLASIGASRKTAVKRSTAHPGGRTCVRTQQCAMKRVFVVGVAIPVHVVPAGIAAAVQTMKVLPTYTPTYHCRWDYSYVGLALTVSPAGSCSTSFATRIPPIPPHSLPSLEATATAHVGSAMG